MNFVIFDYSDGRQEFKMVNEIEQFPEGDVLAFTYYRQDLVDDNGKASSIKYLIGKPVELKSFNWHNPLSTLEYEEKVKSGNYERLFAICGNKPKPIFVPLNNTVRLVDSQKQLSINFYKELSMDFESKVDHNNQSEKRVPRRIGK